MIDAMLLADIASDQADGVVAMVTNAREQVVLDLSGQAESHVEPEVRVGCKVHALGDLHLCPRVIRVGVGIEDDVRNLGAWDEDGACSQVHA